MHNKVSLTLFIVALICIKASYNNYSYRVAPLAIRLALRRRPVGGNWLILSIDTNQVLSKTHVILWVRVDVKSYGVKKKVLAARLAIYTAPGCRNLANDPSTDRFKINE